VPVAVRLGDRQRHAPGHRQHQHEVAVELRARRERHRGAAGPGLDRHAVRRALDGHARERALDLDGKRKRVGRRELHARYLVRLQRQLGLAEARRDHRGDREPQHALRRREQLGVAVADHRALARHEVAEARGVEAVGGLLEQHANVVASPWSALVLALEVGGGIAIIVGWRTRLFAFLLAGFQACRPGAARLRRCSAPVPRRLQTRACPCPQVRPRADLASSRR
jgi:hypothetical protein